MRIVEVDYDPATAYDQWHVPNAVLKRSRNALSALPLLQRAD